MIQQRFHPRMLMNTKYPLNMDIMAGNMVNMASEVSETIPAGSNTMAEKEIKPLRMFDLPVVIVWPRTRATKAD